jgi:predicted phosphodiesterase
MRYLIVSDIHSNNTALEAGLAAAEGRWDKAVCLGDLVGYGPDPNEVVDRIRALDATTIRGNHDRVCCGLTDAEDFNPVARGAVNWTRKQLRPENQQYLEALPSGPLVVNGMVLIHGAIRDEDEYVIAPGQALASLLEASSDLSFFGHTHLQGGFSFHENQLAVIHPKYGAQAGFWPLHVEPGTRYLLNPGSIGQPRDGDARAAFIIADIDHQVIEYWRVPYEIRSVQQRMFRAGLHESLILRLALGR